MVSNNNDKIEEIWKRIDSQIDMDRTHILRDGKKLDYLFLSELIPYLKDNYLSVSDLMDWENSDCGDFYNLMYISNVYKYFFKNMTKDKLLYFYSDLQDKIFSRDKVDHIFGIHYDIDAYKAMSNVITLMLINNKEADIYE